MISDNRLKRYIPWFVLALALLWPAGTGVALAKQAATKKAAVKQAQASPAEAKAAKQGPTDADPSPKAPAPPSPAPSGDPSPPNQAERINITADRLVAETQSRYADFIGSVNAVQGDTVITCDKLRIFYDKQKEGEASGQGAIKRLEAEGNVVIHSQDKVATSAKAVYEMATGVVILSGPGSRVTDGPNTITGEKITLFRNQERMIVEKGGDKRVEAVFFPEKKATN